MAAWPEATSVLPFSSIDQNVETVFPGVALLSGRPNFWSARVSSIPLHLCVGGQTALWALLQEHPWPSPPAPPYLFGAMVFVVLGDKLSRTWGLSAHTSCFLFLRAGARLPSTSLSFLHLPCPAVPPSCPLGQGLPGAPCVSFSELAVSSCCLELAHPSQPWLGFHGDLGFYSPRPGQRRLSWGSLCWCSHGWHGHRSSALSQHTTKTCGDMSALPASDGSSCNFLLF